MNDKILFPLYPFKTKNQNGKCFVFDEIRMKYIVLTPEEEVRQRLIKYLVLYKNVPSTLISLEKSIDVNGMNYRYDVVIHQRNGMPLVLIECKAPNVKITQSVMEQAARYNIACKVSYLMLTNGLSLYMCKIDFENHTWDYLSNIPDYQNL